MIRAIISVLGFIMMAVYFIFSRSPLIARSVYERFNRPVHDRMASICDITDACVIEIIIICLVSAFLIYLVFSVFQFIRDIRAKEHKGLKRFLSFLLTCVMLFSLIYGGFCILWGPYYAAPDVEEICGIKADPEGVLHADLIAVDEFFVAKANEYSSLVARDEEGHFIYSKDPFAHSGKLYDAISVKFPGLHAVTHKPKKFHFSVLMSYIDFNGFFSPFTGEACINTDSPESMTPSVIAHELAHQRGIAAEDEANFVAVITCLEDGDPDFVYSASLLALIHLQNALYKSGDMEQWERIRDSYSEGVTADLEQNSAYWKRFRSSPVNRAASDTYDAFLKSYDQTLGRETYGACVDLLVAYYKQIW